MKIIITIEPEGDNIANSTFALLRAVAECLDDHDMLTDGKPHGGLPLSYIYGRATFEVILDKGEADSGQMP